MGNKLAHVPHVLLELSHSTPWPVLGQGNLPYLWVSYSQGDIYLAFLEAGWGLEFHVYGHQIYLASRMRGTVVFSVNSSITLTSELLNLYYLMKITNFKWQTNLKYGYTIRGLPVTGNKNQIIWALSSKMRVSKKEIYNFRVIKWWNTGRDIFLLRFVLIPTGLSFQNLWISLGSK